MLSCRMGRTSIVNDVSAALPITIGKRSHDRKVGVWRRSAGRASTAAWCWRPFVLPGETVRLEVDDGMHAGLVEVVTPSPERVAPPCPLFTRCGGCHYQHAPYEFQLARKVEILREQLRRVGKIECDRRNRHHQRAAAGLSQSRAVSYRGWKNRLPGAALAHSGAGRPASARSPRRA